MIKPDESKTYLFGTSPEALFNKPTPTNARRTSGTPRSETQTQSSRSDYRQREATDRHRDRDIGPAHVRATAVRHTLMYMGRGRSPV